MRRFIGGSTADGRGMSCDRGNSRARVLRRIRTQTHVRHEPAAAEGARALTGSTMRFMQTLIAEVLAAWRRAERLSETLPADSLERAAAEVASKRLRVLYVDLTKVAGEVDDATARALLADLISPNT